MCVLLVDDHTVVRQAMGRDGPEPEVRQDLLDDFGRLEVGAEELAMDSCTLLTAPPNKVMRRLHDRMSVILPVGEYDQWLDCRGQDAEHLRAALHPSPGDDLIVFRVGTRVNNPVHDALECVMRVD